jgi:hypothetical protein
MVLTERLLQSRQLIRQTLQAFYSPSRRLHREHETGAHRLAIHQHAARAAISFATRDRGTQSETFTKQTSKRLRYRDSAAAGLAIQFDFYGACLHDY